MSDFISEILGYMLILFYLMAGIGWFLSHSQRSERDLLKDIRDELRKKNAREERNREK